MSSSSVEQCTLCASSMHDVHHAIVEVNVVIGVLVVHCELHVVRVVPVVVCDDDVVVRRTLGLIALAVIVVFVVAIFHKILLYGRYTAYRYQEHVESPVFQVRTATPGSEVHLHLEKKVKSSSGDSHEPWE